MTGWHRTEVREATPEDGGHLVLFIDQWHEEGKRYEVWSYATHNRVDKVKIVRGELDAPAWEAAVQRYIDGDHDVDYMPSSFVSPDMLELSSSEPLGSLAEALRLIADDLEAT